MSRWAGVAIAALGALAVVAGCGILPGTGSRAAWVWPTPFPRPPDAVAVPIDVQAIPSPIEADVDYAVCPAALLSPMMPDYRADDAAKPVHYTLVETGQEIKIVWQTGFQAWLRPELEIVAPDGKVIAAEGQVATDLGGGGIGDESDDWFGVCIGEYQPRRTGVQP